MFCNKCGKEINDNIEVCRYCGARANVKGNDKGSESLSHLMENIDSIDVDENGDFVTVPFQGEVDVCATEPLSETERRNVAVQNNQPIAPPPINKNNSASMPATGASKTPIIAGIVIGTIGIIIGIIALAALIINMSGNGMENGDSVPENQDSGYAFDINSENYVEEQTESDGGAVSVTETTKKANSDDEKRTETTETTTETATERNTTQQAVVPSGPMTKTEFISFLNRETAKASKGNYKFTRVCGYTPDGKVNVGNATDTLNKIIKGIDENASLDSVVGGFLGIGNSSGRVRNGVIPEGMKRQYALKAMTLTTADIKAIAVSGNKYAVKLGNFSNPQKNGGNAMSRATNDFFTHQEVVDGITSLTSLITVESTDVQYTNVTLVAVADGDNLKTLEISYGFTAKMTLKAVVTINGNGKATNKITYTIG